MNRPEGLTSSEVSALFNEGKFNKSPKKTTKSFAQIFSDNFFTYFNILNLFLFLLIFLTKEYKNGLFIGVLITNTITGIIQEIRAKKILDKISVVNKSKVTAIRNGELADIKQDEIVIGDCLYFKKGSQVIVDCIVLECDGLSVDESLLTGEEIPISKTKGDTLFSGSYISQGETYAKVLKVGDECYSALITAKARERKKIESEILQHVEKIVRFMSYIIIPSGVLLFLAQKYLANLTLNANIVRTVASMVGMIPNGLVLLITAAYCLAAYRVSKKKALIQENAVIEVFADVETICFDKTGTITDNKGELRQEIPEVFSFLYKNNKKIKIISGDKAEIVGKIAEKTGIVNFNGVKNLAGLSKDETMKAATQFNVFSGASPEQKQWIIEGIKKSGEKIAMAGDGVNDVLALKSADCSISPVSGTDSARGCSGIILLNSDFSALIDIYIEGKKAISNIEKVSSLYLNKTIFSMILTLFTIIYTFFGQVRYPFEPIQMTVISSLFIGIPSFLITFRKKVEKSQGKYLKNVLWRAIPYAISISAGEILVMILNDSKLLTTGALSFCSYFIFGIMAFILLYKVTSPQTLFTKTFNTILLFVYIATLFCGKILNFGLFSLENIVLALLFSSVSVFVLCLFMRKK